MYQPFLEKLWEQNQKGIVAASEEWSAQLQAIYAAGKGLHETLAFLHTSRPDLEAFLEWMKYDPGIEEHSPVTTVFTNDDLEFFKQQGYIILHEAVSLQQCENARQAIMEHLGADIYEPATWYDLKNLTHGLMVPLYQHAALEENRRSPRIRNAFEQLYGSPSIHMVIDKVSFNPPVTNKYNFKGSPLHWDVSLVQPIPFKLQGLLYLNDCDTDAGAFHCVPGFHHIIENWIKNLPGNADPRAFAAETLSPTAIPGKAGDLVIWHQALPHCATANKGKYPRFVQYITYDPDDYAGQEIWM